ncbi:MAG: hypothetical protein A3F93_04005 [Candidatus Magasanikbacteria bacterium RIFCSPLOWO2_12_FULL_34_7]|nr:MAG: hypothetical protein A3F93_04005 [Candidatus Magasanikbacteria bacterium RIFCSPLOWO2_12_FULL_34_7]
MEDKEIILKNIKFYYRRYIFFVFIFLFSIIVNASFWGTVKATTLYFSPSVGSYDSNNIFSVGVYVSNPNESMNAVSALITFPKEVLEVASVSKSNSIINLWVREPSFSNSKGFVNLEGIVLNPGFTGASGKLLTINFKVKTAGLANVLFSEASVLANDGQGTNILTSLNNANFYLGSTNVLSNELVKPPKTFNSPIIYSETHPNPSDWYAKDSINFNWLMTDDVTDVGVLVDQKSFTNSGTVSVGKIDKYTYSNLDDGTWYLHIKLRNASGWGQAGHFQFNVDTEGPKNLEIKIVDRTDMTDPKIDFIFSAEDELSGIDYFEVKIDGTVDKNVDFESATYQAELLGLGNHIITVRAVDKAGNFTEDSIDFVVEELDAPVIDEFNRIITTNDTLIISGRSSANSKVTVWLQNSGGDIIKNIVDSNGDGEFRVTVGDRLNEGTYEIRAEVITDTGAKSRPSDPLLVVVRQPTLTMIGALTITFLSVVVQIAGLLAMLVLLILYFRYKVKKMLLKFRKDLNFTETDLHIAFNNLKKNIKNQEDMLNNKKINHEELTEEDEKLMLERLEVDLDKVEKLITKDIEEIKGKLLKDKLLE